MDLKDIRNIVELMKEHELTKFELEEEGFRIALARGALEEPRFMASMPNAPVPAAPVPVAGEAAAVAAPVDDGLIEIKSPIVGTFYRSGSPEADPFVQVGSDVSLDTVVCIVEAMKVMNEIKADVKGTIVKVLVENATPVQFGQPLFKVKPA